jgi:polar amino acid transport system substrate-binding protein
VKAGNVDLTFTHASPARARDIDFTPPLPGIEQGLLILPGSPISTSALAHMDRPQIRMGVTQGSSSLSTLSREFKSR